MMFYVQLNSFNWFAVHKNPLAIFVYPYSEALLITTNEEPNQQRDRELNELHTNKKLP